MGFREYWLGTPRKCLLLDIERKLQRSGYNRKRLYRRKIRTFRAPSAPHSVFLFHLACRSDLSDDDMLYDLCVLCVVCYSDKFTKSRCVFELLYNMFIYK